MCADLIWLISTVLLFCLAVTDHSSRSCAIFKSVSILCIYSYIMEDENWPEQAPRGMTAAPSWDRSTKNISRGKEARANTRNDPSVLPIRQVKFFPGTCCFVSEALHFVYNINSVWALFRKCCPVFWAMVTEDYVSFPTQCGPDVRLQACFLPVRVPFTAALWSSISRLWKPQLYTWRCLFVLS